MGFSFSDQIFLEALENEFTQCQFQHTKENLSSSGRRKRSLFSAFSCSVKSCTLQTWIARLPSGKALKIFSLGESRHEKDSDPNRNLFEMSRMEFGESGICEFCCKAIANPGNLDPEALLSRHQSGKLTIQGLFYLSPSSYLFLASMTMLI